MALAWSDFLTGPCMVLVNDEIWREELALSPAQFFRAKSQYIILGVGRFTRPPEAQAWLVYTAPTYDSFNYATPTAQTAPIVIATGKTGYELCSVVLDSADANGNAAFTPQTSFTYDAETGNVTLNVDLSAGDEVDIDFYTDGMFTNDLTDETMRLLAKCVQVVWEEHFGGDFLQRTQKVKDKTFNIPNESTWTREQQAKLTALEKSLNDALANFEKNCAYRQTVLSGNRLKMPT
jgi:hypothetical protein